MNKLALKYHWNSIRRTYKLLKKPQVSGTIKEGGIKKVMPKKPNSAQRSSARIILKNKKVISAYIPGEGHNLQSYSTVLVQGGGAQDVPGLMKYSVVRGHGDAQGVKGRKTGRSLYGAKKEKKK